MPFHIELSNVAPSHLMDRDLFSFTTLRATGLPDAAGDRAFDDAEDLCAPPAADHDRPAVVTLRR